MNIIDNTVYGIHETYTKYTCHSICPIFAVKILSDLPVKWQKIYKFSNTPFKNKIGNIIT